MSMIARYFHEASALANKRGPTLPAAAAGGGGGGGGGGGSIQGKHKI
jgi:hypothetical protein